MIWHAIISQSLTSCACMTHMRSVPLPPVRAQPVGCARSTFLRSACDPSLPPNRFLCQRNSASALRSRPHRSFSGRGRASPMLAIVVSLAKAAALLVAL